MNDATAARAFQIADEAMFELLHSEAVPYDSPVSDANAFGLVGENCEEVTTLAAASSAIREAFDWLRARGYVELGTDGVGAYIRVIRRPTAASEVRRERDGGDTAEPPANLPESMSRDEMLRYYSEYANMVANEVTGYQKQIRDLKAALAALSPTPVKDGGAPPSMVDQIRASTEYVSWFPIKPAVRPCDKPGGCNASNCLGCGESPPVNDGGDDKRPICRLEDCDFPTCGCKNVRPPLGVKGGDTAATDGGKEDQHG